MMTKRRLITLLLAMAMIFAILAACAPAAAPDAPAPDADAAPPPAGDAEAPAPPPTPEMPADHDPRAFQPVPDGPWNTPFENPVHITVAAPHGANWHFLPGDDVNNNPWTRLYLEELNVIVEFIWTAPDGEYDTRLSMAIAAGQLPDVFYIGNSLPTLFHELQAAGMLLDLTDAYNNYTSQRIRDFELTDPYTIQGFTVDGRIYGIPRYYYGQIDQPWHMWIRQDWFEQAGSPEIRTVAQLEDLMRTFMRDNGAAYGIGVNDNLQWLLRTAPMFGAYVGNIHEHSYFWMPDATGRIRPGFTFPEFQIALEYWQRWFAEGLISADFMTAGEWGGTAQEDVINGRVGMHCWWQWWGWYSAVGVVENQGNEAVFYPHNLPTLDGSRPARGQIFYPNMGKIVASADFENPAALMKVMSMIDHMIFSPDADLSDEDLWIFMEEGREHSPSMALKIIDPLTDMLQFEYVSRALETGDTSQLFTTGMRFKHSDSLAWINDRSAHGLGAYLQMGSDRSAYARSQHLFDNGHIIQTAMWGLPPVEFVEAGTTGDILLEAITAIIMGHRSVDEWDDIIEQWYALGGQIKEDAINLHHG